MGRSVNNPLAQVLGDTPQLGAEKAEAETEPVWKRQRNKKISQKREVEGSHPYG